MKPYIIPNDDRDYTDTIKFQKKKQKWKESGMSEKDIEKLTNLYHNFDVWGNDKGCNYSNTVIAYQICKRTCYQHNSVFPRQRIVMGIIQLPW